MNNLILSSDEQALVLNYRKEKAENEKKGLFQRRSIATTLDFVNWSNQTGGGLTFSTFVNRAEFGYEGDDATQIYDAVKRILSAALPE